MDLWNYQSKIHCIYKSKEKPQNKAIKNKNVPRNKNQTAGKDCQQFTLKAKKKKWWLCNRMTGAEIFQGYQALTVLEWIIITSPVFSPPLFYLTAWQASYRWGAIRGSAPSHPGPTWGEHCTDRPTTGRSEGRGRLAEGQGGWNYINNRGRD